METKLFEVRDRGTFLPVICVKLSPDNEQERYLLAMTGYGLKPETQGKYVLYAALRDGNFESLPIDHNTTSRTRPVSHAHIVKDWDELASGEVIDVEFILGETSAAKTSQRLNDDALWPLRKMS